MNVRRRYTVSIACATALLALLGACGGSSLGNNLDGGPIVTVIDAGTPTTLAAGAANGPRDIAVDATHVYWNDAQARTVMKVPKGGGAPIALASDQIGVTGLAIDGTNVYWLNATPDAMGTVMKVPLGGGTPIAIASQQAVPNSIAVDATHVYWTTGVTASQPATQPSQTVMKVSLATGAIEMLASGQPNVGSIAVDATAVYWAIFADFNAGAIQTMLLANGTARELTAANFVGSLVVGGGSVYWASNEALGEAARIGKLTLPAGKPTTLFSGASSSVAFSGLVLDGQSLYCGRSDRALVRIAVDGSAATVVPTEGQPIDLAVDDTHLYWTTAEGSVMAMAKP